MVEKEVLNILIKLHEGELHAIQHFKKAASSNTDFDAGATTILEIMEDRFNKRLLRYYKLKSELNSNG